MPTNIASGLANEVRHRARGEATLLSPREGEIIKLMDAETFMSASDAIKRGFADGEAAASTAASAAAKHDPALMARRQTEAALAKAGFSRGDRKNMIAALGGAARDAGTLTGLRALIETLK